MPQMSPMWWTTIFCFSISTLMMMISFTYFMFNNYLKTSKKMLNKKFNWKW
uniref:ATP synthase complex subunit 8 n=2 Tax=Exitianus TaxID=30121 RepID=A0A343K5X7_9HEMI|nr:ATP synthase F0 subunit 8 [Exitianus sp. EMHAU-2015-Zz05232005]ATF28581.1 ATP synthase F0 subunit 8 [Exitianus indicus]